MSPLPDCMGGDCRPEWNWRRTDCPKHGDTAYHYLCCACGGIAPAGDFEALIRDWDTEELRPPRDGETDPQLTCPMCGHVHVDDDANPGIEDGTRANLLAVRGEYLRDSVWADAWERSRS